MDDLNNKTNTIYTIGHSNHEIDKFMRLLKQHGIEVVADVRTSPYSKYSPQFNKDVIKTALNNNGFKYLFLGAELGARPTDTGCYIGGRVSFERLKNTPLFQQGIERLLAGMNTYRVALMCSEKDPVNCHRTILVSRCLTTQGVMVMHILEDGTLVKQSDIEEYLMHSFKIQPGLFDSDIDELIKDAYEKQEKHITYVAHINQGEDNEQW